MELRGLYLHMQVERIVISLKIPMSKSRRESNIAYDFAGKHCAMVEINSEIALKVSFICLFTRVFALLLYVIKSQFAQFHRNMYEYLFKKYSFLKYIQREVSAAARVKVHFKSQDSLPQYYIFCLINTSVNINVLIAIIEGISKTIWKQKSQPFSKTSYFL